VLVERDRLLAVLTTLVKQAAAGCGSLIFLGGEAGVGKTSLAVALADEADELLAVRRGADTGRNGLRSRVDRSVLPFAGHPLIRPGIRRTQCSTA